LDIPVRVAKIVDEAERIRSFELIPDAGGELPAFTVGAHVMVQLPGSLLRQYSLVSDPEDRARYVIAVLREEHGRGGSRWMHDHLRQGDRLTISPPINRFQLAERGTRHLLIAGGIGITPLLAMARRLNRLAADYTLIYCARTPASAAFRHLLESAPFAPHVRFVYDEGDPGRGLDIRHVLAAESEIAHIYCCGPAGMLRAFRKAAAAWPTGRVHYEAFGADSAATATAGENLPFTIVVASTGQCVLVPPEETMLTALLRLGIEVPRLCEQGYCGSCLTRVLDGIPDHRDTVQSDAEKATNEYVTLCCSRAADEVLTLDL
jgi:vanillate monooxygenase ferredoxin subunit